MRLIRQYGTVFFGAAALTAMFAAGWFSAVYLITSSHADGNAKPVRVTDTDFPLISPLVGISLPSTDTFPELRQTERDVRTLVDAAKKSHLADDVGVYFRIPATAHAFGINADDQFDPGSLIKVPIMIAYLKTSEDDPAVLRRMLRYDPTTTDPLPNALPSMLARGSYSVRQLIDAMIIDSDNTAKDILLDHVKQQDLNDVFDEMSIAFIKNPAGTISPKQYITFFNRLYSAVFLDREHSNTALEILSRTKFKDGLVDGLPTGITVAHKYGERGIYEEQHLIGAELHDCGIIYASSTPYYLCVMTRGTDVTKLAQVISSISAAIYADRASFASPK